MYCNGKKFVKSLLLGGAIVTGFAMNSTDSMAAEVDTTEFEPQSVDVQVGEESNQVDEQLQSMEDAVAVIEGDSVAENGYLNQAQDAVEGNTMTDETAEEAFKGGTDVMDQAQTKMDAVDSIYEEITQDTEEAKTEFEEAANDYDLAEQAQKVQQAESTQDKIDALNETADEAEAKHADFVASHGENSADYQAVVEEIDDWQETVSDAKAEYEKVSEYCSELQGKYQQAAQRYEDYGVNSKKYLSEIEALNGEIEAANKELDALYQEINSKGADYVQALASLNEVFADLKQAEGQLEAAADHLKTIVDSGSFDDYSTDTDDYESKLSSYNQINQTLNFRSSELSAAKSAYQTIQEQYSAKNTSVSEKSQKLSELQAAYDQWLIDNPYDEIEAAYNSTGKLLEEATATAEKAERKYNLRKGYMDYLEDLKSGFDATIQAEANKYAAILDAVSNYIIALNNKDTATELKDRADVAYGQTSGLYQSLKNVVDSYYAAQDRHEFEEAVKSADDAQKDSAAVIETEERQLERYAEGVAEDTLTIGEADKMLVDAAAKMDDVVQKNEEAHASYDMIRIEFEKTAVKYGVDLETAGEKSIADIAAELYEIKDESRILENDKKIIQLAVEAEEQLATSDSNLEKATELFYQLFSAMEEYNADVAVVEQSFDVEGTEEEGSPVAHIHFIGKVKGNLEDLDLSGTVQEILTNLKAIAGELSINVTDKNGPVSSLVKYIDFIVKEPWGLDVVFDE